MSTQPDSDLEERKFALDSDIRRREIALREAESKRTGLTAAQTTIAGAVLALVSGLAGAFINAWSSQTIESGKSLTSLQIEELKAKGNLALERNKFETSLILEAIKTPSRSDAIRNLKFFVAAGFVSDPDGKITKLSDENLPSISTPSPESSGRAIGATGQIESQLDVGPVLCTAVAMSPQHVMTANFCISGPNGKSVPQNIKFKTGGQTYPLRVVVQQQESKLALLQVDSPLRLPTFLDRTRIRDPLIGERVYLATALADQGAVQLRVCEIVESSARDSDFKHNCPTGAGSAGAVMIAVADDALLGIHHSGSRELGVAAKLSSALATLGSYLPGPDSVRLR
jgi:hypothetical protein